MNSRCNFIVSLSLGSLAASISAKRSYAQEATIDPKLTVDQVYDLSTLPSIDHEKIKKLSEALAENLGQQILSNNGSVSANCGCNAACTCNSDRNTCCENKCACHSKSGMSGYDPSLIITSPEFEDVVRNFNPEQVDIFKNAVIGVIQSEKYGGPGFGSNDQDLGIEPGTYSPQQLQQRFFPGQGLNGRTAPEEDFILKQFGVE